MFSENVETPPLAIFQLEYNFSAISRWVENKKAEIPPDHKWDTYNDVIRGHKITMLPMDPFLFYHNEVNEFSPAIAGGHSTGLNGFYDIEWGWNHTYFYASINEERHIIFLAPLEDIMYLLKHRRPKPMFDSLKKVLDGGILELGVDDGYCRQIYKQAVSGLIFSNSLFKLTVACDNANSIVLYPDA